MVTFKKTIIISLVLCSLLLVGQAVAKGPAKRAIVVPDNFKTVGEAVMNAKNGDVIFIRQGVYEEKDGLRLKGSLVIIGAGPDKTMIKAGRQGIVIAADGGDINNITVRDLFLELESESVRVFGVNGLLLQNCIVTSRGALPAVEVNTSRNVQILNCTIADSETGISVSSGPVELTIRNSILYNNETGIRVADYPTSGESERREISAAALEAERKRPREDIKIKLFYNDFWNTKDCYNCNKGEFDITRNPEFMDAKKSDFRLNPTSPCVGAGDPAPRFKAPDGSRKNMGAFPFTDRSK